MSKRIHIGIDPGGHSKSSEWAFCMANFEKRIDDPTDAFIITGQENPNGLGCPNLIEQLKYHMPLHRYGKDIVIFIEQPLGNRTNTIASGWCDIGYISAVYSNSPVAVVRADAWKCYLRDSGLVPTMMGHYGMKAKKNKKTGDIKPSYKQILDAHFGLDLTEDSWAAWAICYYNASNYEG